MFKLRCLSQVLSFSKYTCPPESYNKSAPLSTHSAALYKTHWEVTKLAAITGYGMSSGAQLQVEVLSPIWIGSAASEGVSSL